MANLKVIFTNNAIRKMREQHLSEAVVMDTFNTGYTERPAFGGYNAIKKYPGWEVGVYYNHKFTGEWVIISVWTRKRR